MTTTYAANLRAALVTILVAQQTATPNLLRSVTAAMPGGFQELPAAYVDIGAETITHDAGTRTRTFSGTTVVVVDAYTDQTQTEDRMDVLRDLLVDRFDAATSTAIAGTILELIGVTPTEQSTTSRDGLVTVRRALVFDLGGSFIKEGRQ